MRVRSTSKNSINVDSIILAMIIAKDPIEAKRMIISKILEGFKCNSRFGVDIRTEPSFIVVEKPDYIGNSELEYDICGEMYLARFKPYAEKAVKKLLEKPYTRRISIPIWRPKDHLCHTPAAITEISYIVDESLHLTAYLRSLECMNYFELNFDFLYYALEKVADVSGFDVGSLALVVGIPHIYERDAKRANEESEDYKETYGYTELGTHLIEDYISSAWHSALEVIYNNGKRKRTEWGEFFEGQQESLFVHRLFIEVKNPEENKIHDKAPFTEKYGIEYAHDYVIHAASIDKPVTKPILKEGEEYTYAERARYCEKDKVKVDQLYECIKKLDDTCRRDCYVGISRLYDIDSSDPPCLRGYQFVLLRNALGGVFYMRSNDVYGAMHANMFAFALLTKYIAEMKRFEKYRYYHFALDAHIYTQFLDDVRDILYPETPKYSDFI